MSSRPSTTEISSQEAAHSGTSALLASAKYLMLTTFTKDGGPVATTMRVVAEGDRAVFRTSTASGTAKRLRHTGRVQMALCTAMGLYNYGPPVSATARLLAGEEAGQAARVLDRIYPAWRGFLTSLAQRLTGRRTVYYELRADPEEPAVPPTATAHPVTVVRLAPARDGGGSAR